MCASVCKFDDCKSFWFLNNLVHVEPVVILNKLHCRVCVCIHVVFCTQEVPLAWTTQT